MQFELHLLTRQGLNVDDSSLTGSAARAVKLIAPNAASAIAPIIAVRVLNLIMLLLLWPQSVMPMRPVARYSRRDHPV